MTETIERRRLKRLWMPTAILVLGIGGMTALVMTDALEALARVGNRPGHWSGRW